MEPTQRDSTWPKLSRQGTSTSKTASYFVSLLSRLSRKGAMIVFTVCLFGLFFLSLFSFQVRLSSDVQTFADLQGLLEYKSLECSGRQQAATGEIWNAAERKYRGLRDDKFTIAIQTYRRPKELNDTLHLLLNTKIPTLLEIVIIWNDVQTKPPDDFVSPYNVSVRYRVSRRNSLNEKLWPGPDYRTKAILLSDDDVHYSPSDLDFIFQTWRKNGQKRLTGAFARCVSMSGKGQWEYNLCANRDSYSMILTGLAFTHIAFLDYFSSDDPLMTKIREYIDTKLIREEPVLGLVLKTGIICNIT